jgi:hypothetical protein
MFRQQSGGIVAETPGNRFSVSDAYRNCYELRAEVLELADDCVALVDVVADSAHRTPPVPATSDVEPTGMFSTMARDFPSGKVRSISLECLWES